MHTHSQYEHNDKISTKIKADIMINPSNSVSIILSLPAELDVVTLHQNNSFTILKSLLQFKHSIQAQVTLSINQ